MENSVYCGSKVLWNETRGRKFHERNESSIELSFPGTKVPPYGRKFLIPHTGLA